MIHEVIFGLTYFLQRIQHPGARRSSLFSMAEASDIDLGLYGDLEKLFFSFITSDSILGPQQVLTG